MLARLHTPAQSALTNPLLGAPAGAGRLMSFFCLLLARPQPAEGRARNQSVDDAVERVRHAEQHLVDAQAIGLGIAAGAAIALFASRWIADMLYETSAHDLRVYVGAAVVMAIAGGMASVMPARRSARVDPAIALRTE